MKVTISVGGKFHAFNLAYQLQKRGYLEKIFTSHPYFSVRHSGVSPEKVNSLILKEALQRGLVKIPFFRASKKIVHYAHNLFDRQVAGRIRPCDIFVGWSGFCLYTMQRIRKCLPAKIVLERSSMHIETQRDILLDEQERIGIKLDLPFSRIIEKELAEYKEADFIVVPSILAKDSFLNKGFSAEKIIQVLLGVDIENFKPLLKQDNIFRIISVGISIRKGIHYLLQAIEELKIKNIEVWLIGGISDDIRPFLKKYSGIFKYLGIIRNKDLYKYYSQGSISILNSLEDGFGKVVLEAMACGLPVICSEHVGAKAVIREGVDGFVVSVRDVQALKERILFSYENPSLCKDMGKEALENAVTNYSWDKYGERITDIFLNLIS